MISSIRDYTFFFFNFAWIDYKCSNKYPADFLVWADRGHGGWKISCWSTHSKWWTWWSCISGQMGGKRGIDSQYFSDLIFSKSFVSRKLQVKTRYSISIQWVLVSPYITWFLSLQHFIHFTSPLLKYPFLLASMMLLLVFIISLYFLLDLFCWILHLCQVIKCWYSPWLCPGTYSYSIHNPQEISPISFTSATISISQTKIPF